MTPEDPSGGLRDPERLREVLELFVASKPPMMRPGEESEEEPEQAKLGCLLWDLCAEQATATFLVEQGLLSGLLQVGVLLS
jgi:hypothetical protein